MLLSALLNLMMTSHLDLSLKAVTPRLLAGEPYVFGDRHIEWLRGSHVDEGWL